MHRNYNFKRRTRQARLTWNKFRRFLAEPNPHVALTSRSRTFHRNGDMIEQCHNTNMDHPIRSAPARAGQMSSQAPEVRFDDAQRTLRTTRLLLRPLDDHDAAALLRLYADPEVTREYEIDTLSRLDQAQRLLRAYLQFHQRFALTLGPGQDLIGTCGFTLWDQANRMASLGYDLARPFWGQGLMREAATAVLGYGFAAMQLNRVNALTTLYNVRSMKLLAALGFEEEAVLSQFSYWKEAFHDMRIFALLRTRVMAPQA